MQIKYNNDGVHENGKKITNITLDCKIDEEHFPLTSKKKERRYGKEQNLTGLNVILNKKYILIISKFINNKNEATNKNFCL